MHEHNEISLWKRIVDKIKKPTSQENQPTRPPLTEKELDTLTFDQREILELLANIDGRVGEENEPGLTEEMIQKELGTNRVSDLENKMRKALQSLHKHGLVLRMVEKGVTYYAVRPEDEEVINAENNRFSDDMAERFVDLEMRKRNQLN